MFCIFPQIKCILSECKFEAYLVVKIFKISKLSFYRKIFRCISLKNNNESLNAKFNSSGRYQCNSGCKIKFSWRDQHLKNVNWNVTSIFFNIFYRNVRLENVTVFNKIFYCLKLRNFLSFYYFNFTWKHYQKFRNVNGNC